ncbi:ferredoxin [Streptomyces griseorubens]|uniref:ferredoxin n=1 Tax=Streptomyces griseorubens TaxID=66897 RepID=UPI003514F7DB
MPVSVDREECYGSAECVHRAPDVFRVVDGYGDVIPGQEGAHGDPRVIAAAEACPSQAIRISQVG